MIKVKALIHKSASGVRHCIQATRVSIQRHAVLMIVLSILALSMFARPALADSFSIDTSTLLSNAASIFNGLWPAFAIIVGIGFGIGLLKFIVSAISHIF